MTNTTEIYWEISGTSMNTEAWNIRTYGGSRNAPPARRGSNVVVPFRSGAKHVRKVRDERVLDLQMWVLPRNHDGTTDMTMSQEAKMHDNWDAFLALVDINGQFQVRKRWYEAGTAVDAYGMAELADPPVPTVEGGHRIVTTLSLLLSDPWFYGTAISQAVGTIDVEGNAWTEHVELTMGNGRITTPDGNWIQYDGSGTVVVDCWERTAKQGANFMNGLISRNPNFPEWLRLHPGSNALTGAGTIAYAPAYK